jgi:hypothetical protein
LGVSGGREDCRHADIYLSSFTFISRLVKKRLAGQRNNHALQYDITNYMARIVRSHRRGKTPFGAIFVVLSGIAPPYIRRSPFLTYLIRGPPPLLSSEFLKKGGKRVNKERYILLNGEKIFVSEEVYRAYYRPVWREAKQRKVRLEMECSLDTLKDSGFEAESDQVPMDELILDKLLMDKLFLALSDLTSDERSLLHALYLQGKSEREVAKTLGISSVAVHKRKHKALNKLHRLLKG